MTLCVRVSNISTRLLRKLKRLVKQQLFKSSSNEVSKYQVILFVFYLNFLESIFFFFLPGASTKIFQT